MDTPTITLKYTPTKTSETTSNYCFTETSAMKLYYNSTEPSIMTQSFTCKQQQDFHFIQRSIDSIYTTIFFHLMAFYVCNDGRLQVLTLFMAQNRLVIYHSASKTHILQTEYSTSSLPSIVSSCWPTHLPVYVEKTLYKCIRPMASSLSTVDTQHTLVKVATIFSS